MTSSDEVRSQAIEKMGEDLGQLFFLLRKEVAWVHLTWSEYRSLFASSHATFDLFNATAPSFFHHLDYWMWHDVLLHLCRLTDPVESVGKENLTLLALSPLIREPDLRSEVEELASEAKRATQFARDWRNRHLAHRSLSKARNPTGDPLAHASRAAVEAALRAIRDTLLALDGYYLKAETQYQHTQPAPGSAESMLYYLRKGLEAEEAARNR